MKLIDILVEELPKRGGWPKRANCITQDPDKRVEPATCQPGVAKFNYGCEQWFLNSSRIGGFSANILASDYATAIISREQYEAALAAKNDGWIEWGGGECPVPCGTMVDVKHRCGAVSENQQAWPKGHKESDVIVNPLSNAGQAFWRHENSVMDIIAYRLHRPQEAAQPKADGEAYLNEFIGQDAAPVWNGDGLPPVGCECEFISNDTSWGSVVVIGMDGDKVVIKPSGETYYGITPSERRVFRHIRSEADRKRDEAAQALCNAGGGNGKVDEKAGYGSCWFDVYDAIAAGKIPGVKLDN